MGGLGPKFACIGSGSGPKLAALGAYVGGLGSRSGPSWAEVRLHRERIKSSLGAYVGGLGAYVGGLGPKNVKNMATLKMWLFLEWERDLRPGGRS